MRVIGWMWLVAAALLAVPAAGQQPGTAPVAASGRDSAQGQLSVTIHNDDVALVQDVRPLTLPAGVSRQELPDVSACIRPETGTLAGSGSGIVEQKFDHDRLSPARLPGRAVGQQVTLVRVDPATGAETRETARVLANNGGRIVEIGGRIEVIDTRAGLPTRIMVPTLPPDLRARPTLSVTVDAEAAGTRPATPSYPTPGPSWRDDCVARFDEAAGRIAVQGWITPTNTTGTTFADPPLPIRARCWWRVAVPANGVVRLRWRSS